jgi:hypothetical protein
MGGQVFSLIKNKTGIVPEGAIPVFALPTPNAAKSLSRSECSRCMDGPLGLMHSAVPELEV